MISQQDLMRFAQLRGELFAFIGMALKENGHCKSYEGAMQIGFPDYFSADDDGAWSVSLDCYVIGPSRHYTWTGKNFTEALDKAEKEIRGWFGDELNEMFEDSIEI